MKWLKRWSERRKRRKEFGKMFDGVIEAMKDMILFEPNDRETHEHAEIITKNMLLANGCDNVSVSIYPDPEYSSIAKAKIDLVYYGREYEINMVFKPIRVPGLK